MPHFNSIKKEHCKNCGKDYHIDNSFYPGLDYCKVIGCKEPKTHSINYHECILCSYKVLPQNFVKNLFSKL
jgi:hypothetical protein